MEPIPTLQYSVTRHLRVWLILLLFLSSFTFRHSSFAQSASPLVIPFQGQVTNQQNQAVATGQYSIIFNLYDVAVGGQPLWTERHSKVGVVNGMVNVFLGSITSLAAVDFSQTRYLGITVDVDDKPTTADPEMVPRQMVIPAFFAKNSQKMGGYDWTAIMRDGSGNPTSNPVSGYIRNDIIPANSITSSQLVAGSVGFTALAPDVISSLGGTLQQSSLVPTMTALEALSARDTVAITKDGSNNVRLFKANSAVGTRSAFYGFAQAAASVGAAVTVQQFGAMTGFTGLVPGSSYFLGTTDGAITAVYPSGNPIYVGYALSSTTLFIDPFGVTRKWSNQNYWGNGGDGALSTTGDVNLTSVQDGDVVVKQYTSLTINTGHTMTVSDRCRGLVVYVDGNCTINGTLTMTARGASANPAADVNSIGVGGIQLARRKQSATDTLAASDVGGVGAGGVGPAWRSAEALQPGITNNGRIYVVTRDGGATGASVGPFNGGSAGQSIANGTGGGGTSSGSASQTGTYGAAGTCYSGGSGGGGPASGGVTQGPTAGGANGGAGGRAGSGDGSNYGGGGGAGNPGGAGGGGGQGGGNAGSSGTGGLLILFVRGNLVVGATGTVSADGSAGGSIGSISSGAGGGSGGGRILLLYAGALTNSGTVRANGGAGGTSPNNVGKPGGAGAITIDQIDP